MRRPLDLTYTGKISCGIYVYHPFVYILVPILFFQAEVDFSLLPWLLVGTTVGMVALSWRFLESSINSLKNRFAYGGPCAPDSEQRAQAVYL